MSGERSLTYFIGFMSEEERLLVMSVLNGIDHIERIRKAAGNARLGLVTSASGLSSRLRPTIDILRENCNLAALFSPEHGIRGDAPAGERVETGVDPATGLIVHSLYGEHERPDAAMLSQIDMMVFDIQDVGCRYYTYLSTLRLVMEECAAAGKPVVVLDRLNPVNGVSVEGNIPRSEFLSFVGIAPIPQRHGMTLGELAGLFRGEYGVDCELTVIPVSGWDRKEYFESSGLLWASPSPNIPSVDAAVLYSGTCLFEGTNLSEGRGTAKPFEIVGAPWLDAEMFARELNARGLSGVLFRPISFRPSASKHSDVLCRGVQAHITDRNELRPVDTGLVMLEVARELGGNDFSWTAPSSGEERYFIDLLAGTDELRDGSVSDLRVKWRRETDAFLPVRRKYLLY